ncbi:hypothetical protein [Pleomorphomonas oryzae]|uniref:hypothetical protein n=1 Tax=Pleomorphomonas oryzae TaxID=261934 RepID=UPI0004078DBE|nr:hypothetical protein [Pleomorphomonas oryzae]
MKAFFALVVEKLLAVLGTFLRGLIADRQARADAMDLGASRAATATDTVIDEMEAEQDAVDKADRGGAAGVLARLRQHGDGTSGADR